MKENVGEYKRPSPIHDPYVGGKCLLERGLVLDPQPGEVGGPISFFAAFTSPVLSLGPYLLLGGQSAGV